MSYVISTINEQITQLSEQAVLRYMRMKIEPNHTELVDLVRDHLPAFLNDLQAKGCYMTVPVAVCEDVVDFSVFSVESAHLAVNLRGCEYAVLFAATLGMDSELQHRRAAVVSSVKSYVYDAMGSAAVEAFCDLICDRIAANHPQYKLRPRFSPGYGDFSLVHQKKFLDVLDANRKIGVALSEGMLMIPQKSVTAVVGLSKTGCNRAVPNCENCADRDCEFRL